MYRIRSIKSKMRKAGSEVNDLPRREAEPLEATRRPPIRNDSPPRIKPPSSGSNTASFANEVPSQLPRIRLAFAKTRSPRFLKEGKDGSSERRPEQDDGKRRMRKQIPIPTAQHLPVQSGLPVPTLDSAMTDNRRVECNQGSRLIPPYLTLEIELNELTEAIDMRHRLCDRMESPLDYQSHNRVKTTS